MTAKDISFIIPVYNRPDEIDELLQSLAQMKGTRDFEVVIVEDGSDIPSDEVVKQYDTDLYISYYFKPNSGPGDSRNYGMRKAKGTYFIILDSDCILPDTYMDAALAALNANYVDCFGGPDAAHESFTDIQKAINFSMTSVLTTGGIRGRKKSVTKFEPRSFNMGLSKKAFEATGGYGKIHPGEDPDLSIRLVDLGFETRLIPEAYVYHKRRISWSKFYKQVHKFGLARPILNSWHPKTKKLTYWFPSLFMLGLLGALVLVAFKFYVPIVIYGVYFISCFLSCLVQTKNLKVAFLALYAVGIQFLGYGYGFIKAKWKLMGSNKPANEVLPEMFFK